MSKSMLTEQRESLPYNHHLQPFLTFLKQERGFADATIVNRERSLKPFLGWLVAQDVPLSTVSPVMITKYFTGAVAGRWKRTTVSFHVQSLRSFFRYASSRGWCAAGIAESIDAPRLYTHENLPQGPSWEDVKKLVTSVNGTSPVQIRSRCAILLCAVYGLRVGEVCRLRLDDIDWSDERISVRRSKQRKVQTYPLTTEVGNALLRYLKEVRPRCPHREVLLTLRRPYRPVSVGALSTMTRKLQKTTRPEAQAIWLARIASCLCHAPSGPGSDTEGGGRSPGTHVRSGYSNLREGRSDGTARSRRLGREAARCLHRAV